MQLQGCISFCKIYLLSCNFSCVWILQAGYEYDDETFDKVFKRIYSSFGSSAPYSVFPDSQPFLRWARQKGLTIGLVSNAEYRYQDVILPALGLNKVLLAMPYSVGKFTTCLIEMQQNKYWALFLFVVVYESLVLPITLSSMPYSVGKFATYTSLA